MPFKIEDAPPEVLEKLGLAAPKKRLRTFTAEMERRHAIKCLGQIADLEQSQRARVLRRALKMNEV
jgi:hypothetical protein